MASPVRKRTADSQEWWGESKAARISWRLPLNCSPEEKKCLEEVLHLITKQLGRDSNGIFQKVRGIIDRKISPKEIMAELGALEYLLRKNWVEPDCSSYRDALKDLVANFLQKRTSEYLDSGDCRKKTPSGRTHYLLNLFCELLVIDESGISKAGMAAVRALLGPSSASCYLEHEHRDHIISILNCLEFDSSFFSSPLSLDPRLMKFCRIDRKMAETTPLFPLDVKRWVMQMLLTDILQFEGQGNCYAVSSFKFGLANYLGLFLQKLHPILEKGVYQIGNKSIDLAVLMELFLIRDKELDVSIPLSGIPVFQDLRSFGFKMEEALSIRAAADEPYLQAVICSYHRNLLQQLVMICMRLPGFNGAYERRPLWNGFIEDMIGFAIPHRSNAVTRILSESLWGLDCELQCVLHESGKILIAGHEVPFSGSLKCLETLLKAPCLLLIVDAENKTHVIFTIEQLLHQLNRLIQQALAIRYDLWPENKRGALKNWMAKLHSLPDEDWGSLVLFTAYGGVSRYVIEYWGFPHRLVSYSKDQGDRSYFESVAEKARGLPLWSRVLLCRDRHAFTSIKQEIASNKIDRILQQALAEDPRRLEGKESQENLSVGDVNRVLGRILSKLRVDFRKSQLRQIESELSVRSANLPEVWARRLRLILIKYGLAVPNPADIEALLRKELGLPKAHYIGDLNWIDGKRRHTRLRLEPKKIESGSYKLVEVRQWGRRREWIIPEDEHDSGWFIMPLHLRA